MGPNLQGDFVDAKGHIWYPIILDNDTVQKTMPGNRMVSHRALVMVGNLKGSGGFGIGKASTPAEALTLAFRNSLRRLVHIDLYDNFGFAHDLYGRHNACHVYIRATPGSREMVGGGVAMEVLNRMGVSSASVKIIGNRNPYSVINALFKAIKKHENLDETARDRGKRYLSLKWAHEQDI